MEKKYYFIGGAVVFGLGFALGAFHADHTFGEIIKELKILLAVVW